MSSLRNSHILSFSRRRDRTSERASGQAKECVWSDEKNGENGKGRIRSQFRSLYVLFWKRVLLDDYSLIIADYR